MSNNPYNHGIKVNHLTKSQNIISIIQVIHWVSNRWMCNEMRHNYISSDQCEVRMNRYTVRKAINVVNPWNVKDKMYMNGSLECIPV